MVIVFGVAEATANGFENNNYSQSHYIERFYIIHGIRYLPFTTLLLSKDA